MESKGLGPSSATAERTIGAGPSTSGTANVKTPAPAPARKLGRTPTGRRPPPRTSAPAAPSTSKPANLDPTKKPAEFSDAQKQAGAQKPVQAAAKSGTGKTAAAQKSAHPSARSDGAQRRSPARRSTSQERRNSRHREDSRSASLDRRPSNRRSVYRTRPDTRLTDTRHRMRRSPSPGRAHNGRSTDRDLRTHVRSRSVERDRGPSDRRASPQLRRRPRSSPEKRAPERRRSAQRSRSPVRRASERRPGAPRSRSPARRASHRRLSVPRSNSSDKRRSGSPAARDRRRADGRSLERPSSERQRRTVEPRESDRGGQPTQKTERLPINGDKAIHRDRPAEQRKPGSVSDQGRPASAPTGSHKRALPEVQTSERAAKRPRLQDSASVLPGRSAVESSEHLRPIPQRTEPGSQAKAEGAVGSAQNASASNVQAGRKRRWDSAPSDPFGADPGMSAHAHSSAAAGTAAKQQAERAEHTSAWATADILQPGARQHSSWGVEQPQQKSRWEFRAPEADSQPTGWGDDLPQQERYWDPWPRDAHGSPLAPHGWIDGPEEQAGSAAGAEWAGQAAENGGRRVWLDSQHEGTEHGSDQLCSSDAAEPGGEWPPHEHPVQINSSAERCNALSAPQQISGPEHLCMLSPSPFDMDLSGRREVYMSEQQLMPLNTVKGSQWQVKVPSTPEQKSTSSKSVEESLEKSYFGSLKNAVNLPVMSDRPSDCHARPMHNSSPHQSMNGGPSSHTGTSTRTMSKKSLSRKDEGVQSSRPYQTRKKQGKQVHCLHSPINFTLESMSEEAELLSEANITSDPP